MTAPFAEQLFISYHEISIVKISENPKVTGYLYCFITTFYVSPLITFRIKNGKQSNHIFVTP